MFALNKNSFEGHREVTCYSCHRGARDPAATPIVETESQPSLRAANSKTQELPTNLPTASQLLVDYVRALGGAAAIEKITSRVEKGLERIHDKSVGVEVFTQAPDKQALVRHLPEGDSFTIFDGQAGWFVTADRPARDMHGSDLDDTRMDADLQFPLHIRQIFAELRVEYPEKIGDREVYVLFCVREGQAVTKLYFDEKSGLLVRLVRYTKSPLGLDPKQVDYADYRAVDGVQVPFRVTVSEPGSSAILQLEEVQQNVPIDDTRFSKPPS
jgi:photosynthetic reaction center cytochrome c subunit